MQKGENKVLTSKTDNLEITKMLTLSTTHINPKTCSFLDSENIESTKRSSRNNQLHKIQ